LSTWAEFHVFDFSTLTVIPTCYAKGAAVVSVKSHFSRVDLRELVKETA
jgi:hypothetical protein